MLPWLQKTFTDPFRSASDENFARSSRFEIESSASTTDRLSLLADAIDREGDQIQDVVFIGDLARSSEETWNTESIRSLLKPHDFRTYIFEYKPIISHHLQGLVHFEAIETHAQRLLNELRQIKGQRGESRFTPLFVAHGYGGLICELAYLLNLQVINRVEMDGFVLFGTPHFRAGLAQWALISAKKLGISCANRPRLQDWSGLQDDLNLIADMQTRFCDLNPGPKLACCFAILPTMKPELMISPEWATLPGAMSIPINSDHFNMTRLDGNDSQQLRNLSTLLKGGLRVRLGEEALLQHWEESTKQHSDVEADSVAKIAKQLVPDKRVDHFDITQSVVELTVSHENDGIRSTKWLLEEVGDRITDKDILRLLKAAAANERQGKAILELLLARYGSPTAITEDIVQSAAGNKNNGLRILKFLVDRDDGSIPVSQEAIEAAAGIEHDGLERLELLLKQREDPVVITNKIVEVAPKNKIKRVEMLALLLAKKKIEVSFAEAVEKGFDDVAQFLLDTGEIDVNSQEKDGWTPLLRAVQGGREIIVHRLLDDKRVDVNLAKYNGDTPLILAVDRRNSAITNLLLNASKIDVNQSRALPDPWTPLFLASYRGYTEIVEQLLGSNGIQPHLARNGQTPLSVAAEMGHEPIVNLLLETDKVDTNSEDHNGWTPLTYAVKANGGYGMIKRLLEAGADAEKINIRDSNGRTPFLWAAIHGKEDIVRLLLSTDKVDIDVRDARGCTPFWWAAGLGHVGIMEVLLEKGKVDVHVQRDNKQTPLLRAARNGHEGSVKVLLDTGEMEEADINARDEDGRTPFWWAANKRYEGIRRLLLETGMVDEDIRDNNGATPYDYK